MRTRLRERPEPGAGASRPPVRRGDSGADPARAARRRASRGLWDACEALLSSSAEPRALSRALDGLRASLACDGVALHARNAAGRIEPWCARGRWRVSAGDLRECLSVPLFRGRERVGTLDLMGRAGQRWRSPEHSLIRAAAGALGAALGARLELDRLRRQPGRDAVTGLPDARSFHLRLTEELSRVRRGGLALSVVLLDLDHFGALNARYGQPTGDAVLSEVALVLRLGIRESDVLARLGGDSFAVLLPECDPGAARRCAQRLRRSLEDHRFPRAGRISASAGVATTPRDGLDAVEVMAGADAALASAKKGGRRRTVAAAPAYAH